jgi:hypothetical protein
MSAPCRCPHCPPSPTVAGSELSSWGKQPGPLSPGATDPQKGCLFRVRPGENARLTLEQGNKLEERLTRNRTRPPDPNQNSRTAPPPPRTRAVPKGWGPLVAPSPWVVFPRTHPRKSPAATFPPKLGSQGQHPRTVRGGRGHRGRPGWVPPETVAGVPKVASWVSARSWGMRGEGITGQVRLGCRVSREVPVLLQFPALRSRRNSGRRGQREKESGRAGSHSPRQTERGGPLSAAAAPALSARLHQPWRGRAPAGSPTVRLGLEPGPRPHCPRRGSAPSPAPALARGPPPAAAGTAGAPATAPGTIQLGPRPGGDLS